jgi:hypothetical protein
LVVHSTTWAISGKLSELLDTANRRIQMAAAGAHEYANAEEDFVARDTGNAGDS